MKWLVTMHKHSALSMWEQ